MLKINILGAEYTIEYLKRDDDPLFKKNSYNTSAVQCSYPATPVFLILTHFGAGSFVWISGLFPSTQ